MVFLQIVDENVNNEQISNSRRNSIFALMKESRNDLERGAFEVFNATTRLKIVKEMRELWLSL